jgi:hypothetical protein
MFNQTLTLPCLVVSLAACAGPMINVKETSQQITSAVEAWRGASKDMLLLTWGPPSHTAELEAGGSILAYEKTTLHQTATMTSSPSASPLAPSRQTAESSVDSLSCSVTFFVSAAGTIERTEITGNLGPCAELVRSRPDQPPSTTGYAKQGHELVWVQNGVTARLDTSLPQLPSRLATPSPALAGRWKMTGAECFPGKPTERGRVTFEGVAKHLEAYVLDFDAMTSESPVGSCTERASLRVEPLGGRWVVHFSKFTAEGCSPYPDLDRLMEIDSAGRLLDYSFGPPDQMAQFCTGGRWVQVFARLEP